MKTQKLSYQCLTALILMGLAIFLTGCATSKPDKFSGWLKDYSKLEKGPEDGADYRYINPDADFSKYSKVQVDKVIYYFTPNSEAIGIQPDILKQLSDTFERELIENINDAYPMVATSGPDVLRIRIAITDVEPGNPVLGTVGAVLPVGMVVNAVSNAETGESVNVGSASIEAEFLDSVSGEVLASLVDRKAGSTYDTATVKGEWGHAQKAFRQWAQQLRKKLDNTHAHLQP